MPANHTAVTSQALRIPLSGVEARAAIEREGLDRLLPAWSIRGALAATAAIEPDKAAISFLRDAGAPDLVDTLSYRSFFGRVETAASLFREVSQGPSVVSVVAPLLPEAVVAMWGAAIAGVCNPINPFLDVRHIASIMNAGRSTALVTCTGAAGAGAWNQLDELVAMVPSLRRVLVIHSPGTGDGRDTAVGKIFKPALRLDAMRRAAVKTVLATLGDASAVRVDVRETETRPAVILGVPSGPAAAVAHSLRTAFAGYTFETRITLETPAE